MFLYIIWLAVKSAFYFYMFFYEKNLDNSKQFCIFATEIINTIKLT